MANIKKLKANGEDIVPVTHEQAVLDSNGVTLESKLNTINNAISRLENNSTSGTPSLVGNTLTFGNYTITYNETDDTLDFVYNGTTNEPGTDGITWLTDYSFNEVGELEAKTGNAVTDFIIYDNSFEYLLSKDTVMNFRCYFYDNNKTFISRTDNDNDLSTVDSKITFPENTAYFRLKLMLNKVASSEVSSHVSIKKIAISVDEPETGGDTPDESEDGTVQLTWIDNTKPSSSTGVLGANNGSTCTEFIPYDSSYEYTLVIDAVVYFRVFYYDSSESYISNDEIADNFNGVITPPENATYMRLKALKDTVAFADLNNHVTLRKTLK